MIASNKTITRWICAYFNSWSVNFPVLAENFIDLFAIVAIKYFISFPKLALSEETVRNLDKLILFCWDQKINFFDKILTKIFKFYFIHFFLLPQQK